MDKLKIFKEAQKKKIAIGQFNFSTISQFWGIISAMKNQKKPFILGTSEGESQFLGFKTAVALRDMAEQETKVPVILNLDHGKYFKHIKEAVDAGYDMVHFDGSFLSLEENIKETKKIVSFAKKKNIIVEGELGYLRGSSTIHQKNIKPKIEEMTMPDEAESFVKKTGVNLLAIAIGNIHGICAKEPNLDLERLFMIKSKVGRKAFLVLHGGSGISNKNIKEAIRRGIVKININTEIRIAWRKGMERALLKTKGEVAPYKLAPEASKEVEKIIKKKMNLFYNR